MFKIGEQVVVKNEHVLVESMRGTTYTVTCVLGDLVEISDGTNRKVVPECFIEKLETKEIKE